MMGPLIRLRFRALAAGFTAGSRRRGKTGGKGTAVFLAILFVYLGAMIALLMGTTFYNLAGPYHQAGLDWLYFAVAGLMGTALAVFGSVFSTQSQLYEAKDNELLLSMPIRPRAILLSRLLPLLAMNLVFAGVVMIPAMVVYGAVVGSSFGQVLCQTAGLLGVTVLSQAIACLLGWLLHLLLSRMNKSLASLLYMVAFLAVYFLVYSQAQELLTRLTEQSGSLAAALKSWVWPLYALGQGCLGRPWALLAFLAVAAGCFCIIWGVLSATFLRTARVSRSSRKRGSLELSRLAVRTPAQAIAQKELRRFLGTPVYLTNMGLGLILTAALTVAGAVFRDTVLELLDWMGLREWTPLLLCAVLAFLISTCCVSTPSVSLEGKSIWILKSMPLTGRQILLAKLRFHCVMTVPVTVLSALALGILYGCGAVGTALATAVCALLSVLCGVLGLAAGLKWAQLDYLSEAYPCKQSMAVVVTLLSMMGIPLLLAVGCVLTHRFLSIPAFLAVAAGVLALLCLLFYRVVVTWGVKKWDSL